MANQSIFAAFERMWQHVLAVVGGKASVDHTHDDLYYTEAEIDTALAAKADKEHTHDFSAYETKEDAQTKFDEAKSYTDSKVSGFATTSSVNTSISNHNTSTSAHNDIRELISDLSTAVNKFLDVDDTTVDQLSEVLTLIENNKDTLESLTTTKINVSDIVNNLTTNSESKVLSAAQGVAIKSLIDTLQDELDEVSTFTETIDLSIYETKEDSQKKLDEAKSYTDSKVPTKISQLTNDSGYITSEALTAISNDEIDEICGASIVAASEVIF